MTILKIVCAFCGKDLGEKDGEGVEGVSHGCCDECFKKRVADLPPGEVCLPC